MQKFNQVQVNRIVREMIRREEKYSTTTETCIINPHGLVTIPMKPPNMNPTVLEHEALANAAQTNALEGTDLSSMNADDLIKLDLRKRLKDARRMPQEKSEFPRTEAEEIGWFSSEAEGKEKYYYPKCNCKETLYATAYVKANGVSPYSCKRSQ